uniref:Alkaline ceramidase n=1 Tax=Arcella intermedia TaxID=1963864 RepID=A0A6B2LEI0_9EUKA|eukprot:TRINITY_DN3394_c0_g1_i2.p1 TRINITY_DN3394_c0_g1~~TRINITY_DN3394_c0_g1_i2.p1  ORF type:complete len:181 (-),score=13.56 TRINITY_DN3394_c0_g1_i2:40-582(-)
MQLLDELPMIYATCVFVYCVLEDKKKSKYGPMLPVSLFLTAVLITLTYIVWQDPIFHQVCYGLLVAVVVLKCAGVYRTWPDPIYRKYIPLGVGAYLLGFALWNIDNQFCDALTRWKEDLYPFSPFFELHAWWHFLTALGTYLYIFCNSYHRSMMIGRDVEVHYVGYFVPVLHLNDRKKFL